MEGGSNKEEQPTGTKRGKKQKLAAVDTDQQYLDSLKEIDKRMEETNNDSDRMFLLNLLPAIKQLSSLDNMDFRVKVQEDFQRKLRRHAAREVELIMYPSMLSASPALSQYIGNSLVDYTSTSEGHEKNATYIVAVVIRQDHLCKTHCTSYENALLKIQKIILFSYCIFLFSLF